MRKIVYYPNKVLRVKTLPIVTVDESLRQDIKDLVEVLENNRKHAAGLAAVQIGLERRFFGLVLGEQKKLQVYINPKIEKVYGAKVRPMMVYEDGVQEPFLEGCLSFPDLFGIVKRYLKIDVSWDEIEDDKLVRHKGTMEGIEAIAFQHESEHLDGILFIDHIRDEGRELYKWLKDEKIKWDIDKVVSEEKGI